jgi:hypothetical protein
MKFHLDLNVLRHICDGIRIASESVEFVCNVQVFASNVRQ